MGARIFISYGHRDAGELAARLRTELEGAGHTVWHDVDGIRVAHGWSSEIADALRGSDLVVALLSPHSVRRSVDPANPDGVDSVCIDEIEYAVDAVRIPVVPLLVKTCEAPFRIFRLQYIDFRAAEESEARYGELAQQLLGSIDKVLETGRSPIRTWGFLPEPWDFSAFLAERRRRFTGRDWLFAEIEKWRTNPGSRSMLIVGGPGVGKSAVVAQLVHENPDGQVLAYHCCQADTPATLSAATFVRSIAGQLSSRVEGYAQALETPRIRDALDVAAIESDPASAFEAGVLAPLTKLPEPAGGSRYILVDALDEALLLDEGSNVLDVLATRLSRFPSWLRVVATTRPKPAVLRRLRGVEQVVLDAEDARNRGDVRGFIRDNLGDDRFAEAVRESAKSSDEIVDLLATAGAGNFLYVTQALEAVGRGQLLLSEVAQLPPGLGSLYEVFFERIFAQAEVPFESSRRVLEAIVAALEPASRAELAAVTGLDEEYELPKILARLAAFVPATGGRYSVFHASVTEWLTGWDAKLDQPITADYYISSAGGHGIWAEHLLGRHEVGDGTDPIVIQRLPTHLAGARRWDDLARVLTDWRFLESKVIGDASSVFDLLADFNLANASMPASHPKLALLRLLGEILSLDGQFIGQHPETLFQCCWNRGYWHDSAIAAEYFEVAAPAAGGAADAFLSQFVERWRNERALGPDAPWIRYLRPPVERLGAAQRAVLVGHTDALNHVVVSPDGTRLVSADGEDGAIVRVWDIASGSPLIERDLGDEEDPQGIGFTPDGAQLVVAHWRGTLSTLDAETLETTATLALTDENLSCLSLSPDGRWAGIGDWGGTIHVVDLQSWKIVASEKVLDGTIEDLALSRSGERIVAGDSYYGGPSSTVLCDRASLRVELRLPSKEHVVAVAFTPDGGSLVWGDYEGRVCIRNLETGSESVLQDAPSRNLSGVEEVASIGSLSFLGERLLVGTAPVWGRADILVWDTDTKEIIHRLAGHQFAVSGLASIDDVSRFASAGDSTVRIWDLGRIVGPMPTLREPQVGHLEFSEAAGAVITAAGQSELVWVRSQDDGSLIRFFDGHEEGVHSLASCSGEQRLACGTGAGGVRVWDLESGDLLLSNQPHKAIVGAVRLAPESELLASGSNDGTVCIQTIGDPGPPIMVKMDDWSQEIAFSPSGDRLAVAGLTTIGIWNTRDGALLWSREKKSFVHRLLLLDDGLVMECVGEELGELDVATGQEQPVSDAHREEWMRRAGYIDRTWAWRGTFPAGPTRKETGYRQEMAELIRIDGGQSVAWLPLLLGGVSYHPDRPTWANRRGDSAAVFCLEGGDLGVR